ncbi:MAG: DUF362 domain-containing protein [Desulfobacterales bacterium]|nr:DUF362 domain-containing protein [Desulfobacterales bacterium]
MMSGPQQQATVYSISFRSWTASVPPLLAAAGLAAALRNRPRVLIKPNLVENLHPPITTPVELVEALVDYIRDQAPDTEIIIGEGCGSLEYDTGHCFQALGYKALADAKKIRLVDLNQAPLVRRSRRECRRWPEMHLPGMVYESFLISVPVLKAHTLAGVTLTMKNMMGLAPPAYYQQGGHWKKAAFHQSIQEALFDLNRYRTPDFTLLDASVGMARAHLRGPTCNPPVNRLVAGFDPVAIDAYGARLLKRNWRDIGHIRMAHRVLGLAEPLDIRQIRP